MKPIQHWTLLAVVACAVLAAGCSSGVKGTYSDQAGSFLLELESGGNANITFGGEVASCTYTTSGQTLTLDCKGGPGKLAFTIHDDGSLTGPPGSFMPMLRKSK